MTVIEETPWCWSLRKWGRVCALVLLIWIWQPTLLWGQQDYATDRVVIKYKTGTLAGRNIERGHLLAGATEKPMFPIKTPARARGGESTKTGLERISYLFLPEGVSVEEAVQQLRQHPDLEYAEPYYLAQKLVVPSDPEARTNGGAQDYLSVISAYNAWDITQGDPSVVIAILDSGTDSTHEDILGKVSLNEADPINGIDDDENGYVDDYVGWDMADGDNDPEADTDPHGFRVAGISVANTDNSTGIASVGYNSGYLPIKIFRSGSNILFMGYESIVYAADRGAKVINLSWKTNGISFLARDMVSYAVEERDAVVVAAAGNTPADLDIIPASLPGVLSVGATDINDNKASFSTWSPTIDLVAPGVQVYTLDSDNGYTQVNGTSFAAPQVSGVAALIRAYRPHLTAKQVQEQIRVTADDIYSIGGNSTYRYLLGKGRLNAANAVGDTTRTAVRLEGGKSLGPVGEFVAFGDTLYLTGHWLSYLAPWLEGTAQLTTTSPYVTLLDSIVTVDSLGTLGEIATDTVFRLYLSRDLPADTQIDLRIDYTGRDYDDFQNWRLRSEPSYIDLDNGTLLATVSDRGNVGYFQDVKQSGIGVMWKGASLMDHAGLVIATGPNQVSDNAIRDLSALNREQDFTALLPLKPYANSKAALDFRSWFQEGVANPKTGIRVEQRWLAQHADGTEPWLVVEYGLVNPTDSVLDSLVVGWIGDYEVLDETTNRVAFDSIGGFAYVTDSAGTDFFGIGWLVQDSILFRAIDWGSNAGNTPDLTDLVTRQQKYDLLTSASPKLTAGELGAGNDVGMATGYWLPQLVAGGRKELAFTMMVGNSLDELRSHLADAKAFYQEYQEKPTLWETLVTCQGEVASIDPSIGNQFIFYADAQGMVPLDTAQVLVTDVLAADTIFFVAPFDSGYAEDIYQLNVSVTLPSSVFTFSEDTLVMDPGGFVQITPEEQSANAVSWAWDFGQGTQSSQQQPTLAYSEPGEYLVSLTVTNSLGCTQTSMKPIWVFSRADKPIAPDVTVCKGDSYILNASNTSHIAAFADETLRVLVDSGASVALGPLSANTTYWLVNQAGLFDSRAVSWTISVRSVEAAILTNPDTLINEYYGVQLKRDGFSADSLAWYQGDQLLSDSDTAHLAVSSQEQIPISLVSIDKSLGCRDSTGTLLAIDLSEKLPERAMHLCKGDVVEWASSSDQVYAFSRDKQGMEIFHKGKFYSQVVSSTDTLWVASLTRFLPGDFTPFVARVVSPAFETDSPKDTFQVLDTTVFDAVDDLVAYSFWQIDEGNFQSLDRLEHIWLSPGTYDVRHIVIDSLGCRDTLVQQYVVEPRTPLDTVTSLREVTDTWWQIFPNPASAHVAVKWGHPWWMPNQIRLLASNGQRVIVSNWNPQNPSIMRLDISNLPSGIYWVELEGDFGVLRKPIARE